MRKHSKYLSVFLLLFLIIGGCDIDFGGTNDDDEGEYEELTLKNVEAYSGGGRGSPAIFFESSFSFSRSPFSSGHTRWMVSMVTVSRRSPSMLFTG